MLVPASEGCEDLLSHLYGINWAILKPSDKAFMLDKGIEAAICHVQSVCHELDVGISVCGNPKQPTLRMWWNKRVEPEQVAIDLKWACWSEHKQEWVEHAPGMWERMENAFHGKSGPIQISTAPRKEIRFGSVLIQKGQASGHFVTEWDSVEDLADNLKTEADKGFRELIPYTTRRAEPGCEWDFKLHGRKFSSFMRSIDLEEAKLLDYDRQEWGSIKALFSTKGGEAHAGS
jgi:hypothetical protein